MMSILMCSRKAAKSLYCFLFGDCTEEDYDGTGVSGGVMMQAAYDW